MQIGNYVSIQHKGTVALMSYQTMLILHGKLVITWYVTFFQGIYQFVIIYLLVCISQPLRACLL